MMQVGDGGCFHISKNHAVFHRVEKQEGGRDQLIQRKEDRKLR